MSAASRATAKHQPTNLFSYDHGLETVVDDDVVNSCKKLFEIDQELHRARCILESDKESLVRVVHPTYHYQLSKEDEARREMQLKNRVQIKLKEIQELNNEMAERIHFLRQKMPREKFESLCACFSKAVGGFHLSNVTGSAQSVDLPQSGTCSPNWGNRETSMGVERKFSGMNTDTNPSDRASGYKPHVSSEDSGKLYSRSTPNLQLQTTDSLAIFSELKALQHPGIGALVQKIVKLKHAVSLTERLMRNDLLSVEYNILIKDDILWLCMQAKLKKISQLKDDFRMRVFELRKKLSPDLFNRYCERYNIVAEDYEADGEVNRHGSGASLLYLLPVAVDSNPKLTNSERKALKDPDVAQVVKSILSHKQKLVLIAELLRQDLQNLELGTVPTDMREMKGRAPGACIVLRARSRQTEVNRLRCEINKFVAKLREKTSADVYAHFCDCYRVFADNWNDVVMDTTNDNPTDGTDQKGEITGNVPAVESQIRAKNRTVIDYSHSLNPTTQNQPSPLLPGTNSLRGSPPVTNICDQIGGLTDPTNLEQVKTVISLKHQLAAAEKRLQSDLQCQATGVIPADLVQIDNMTILASMQVRIQSTRNTVDYLKRTISDNLSALYQLLPSEMFNQLREPLEAQAISPDSCQQYNKTASDASINPLLTANVDWRPVLDDIAALGDPSAWHIAKNVEKLHQRLSFLKQQNRSQLLNESQTHVNDVVAKVNEGLVAKINKDIASLKRKLPPSILKHLYNCCWPNVETPDELSANPPLFQHDRDLRRNNDASRSNPPLFQHDRDLRRNNDASRSNPVVDSELGRVTEYSHGGQSFRPESRVANKANFVVGPPVIEQESSNRLRQTTQSNLNETDEADGSIASQGDVLHDQLLSPDVLLRVNKVINNMNSGRLTVEEHKKAEYEVNVLLSQSKQNPGKKRVTPCDPEIPLKRQFLMPADPLQQLLHDQSVLQNLYNKTEHYSQSEQAKYREDDIHEHFPSRQSTLVDSTPLWTQGRKTGGNSVDMQKRSDLCPGPDVQANRRSVHRRRPNRKSPSGDEDSSSRKRISDDIYSNSRRPFSNDFRPEKTPRYADSRSALDDEHLDTSQRRERRTATGYLDSNSNVATRSRRTSSGDYSQSKSSRRSDYGATSGYADSSRLGYRDRR